MDENAFNVDPAQLGEASHRFPLRRPTRRAPRPRADLSCLAAPSAEFGRHAWDEAGH